MAQIYPRSGRQVFLYANTGFMGGSPSGARASVAALVAMRHELSVGYNFYSKKARATPSDYLAGQGWFGLTPYPQDWLEGLTLIYGYVYYPPRMPKVRYVLRAGVLIGHLTTSENFRPVYGGFNLFGPPNPAPTPGYYAYSKATRGQAAFVLQPTLDYSPVQAFAFSIGLYGVFSEGMSGGGVTGSILLGKVSNVRRTIPARMLERRKHRKFRKAKRWAGMDD